MAGLGFGQHQPRRAGKRGVLHTGAGGDVGVDPHAQAAQRQFAQRPRRHRRGGDAAGKMPAAPGVLEAFILGEGGVVRVAGAQQRRGFGIVAAAGVGVAQQHRDGGAGGVAVQHAGQELHLIRLGAGGGKPVAPGAAAVHLPGQEIGVHRQAGGQAVQHRPHRRAVAFPEDGQRDRAAKSVFHRQAPYSSSSPSRAGRPDIGMASARQQPSPGTRITVIVLPAPFLSCCI